MLNERYQVSGMPVGGGGQVTGYCVFDNDGDCFIITGIGGIITCCGECGMPDIAATQVDPATLEPVREKPIEKDAIGYKGVSIKNYYCSICGDYLMGKPNYCPDCGMALDWSDPESK